MKKHNIFSDIPDSFPEEILETIVENGRLKLERILSSRQSTPAGEWFDQEKNEWVILLKGKAVLRFENEEKIIEMAAGDYLLIPAHAKHRVEWTAKNEKTVWLALHY